MDAIPRFDTLALYQKSLYVRQTLEENEELMYSCDLSKYNRYGFSQDRILLVTTRHLLTLDFGPFNYNVHRKVPINLVEAITSSKITKTHELVLHFVGDYDERYDAGHHLKNLINIVRKILKANGQTWKRYIVPDKKLRKFNTTKKDARKGKFLRPDD